MRAIGIVLAGGNSSKMGILAEKRAVSAMPVAGSYRSVDFALSNMSNSHIQKVAVCTQFNARSLNQHLNSSKWWDFGRKQGGLFVLTPTITLENDSWYRGTADAIYQNMDFLKDSHEPYVIITSADCVYKMDYNKMLEQHIAKKADITVAYTHVPEHGDDLRRFGVLTMDEDGRIREFEEKPETADSSIINAGIYVIRRRLLIELLEKANSENRYDFVKDILVRYRETRLIYGYELKGYWSNIATVDSYYNTNMDFLRRDVRDYFFGDYDGIYSKIEDQPPAKYNPGASMKNALVSSGCIINGKVENSVLFRKVYVGANCVIRNSIILNDVYIGDNTVIENCIVESRGTIKANEVYKGEPGNIRIVIEENDRYRI